MPSPEFQHSLETDSFQNQAYLPYDSQKAVDYYEHVYSGFWEAFPNEFIEDYVQTVKQVPNSKGLVLCVGSGLGDEAEMLQSYGLRAICLDGAMEMSKTCAAKNLPSIRGNFLQLPFGRREFDGIWVYKTLNHAKDMHQLNAAFLEIRRVIKYKGVLGICMLKGRQNDRKSSFFDGMSTRENLYLTEDTFHELLEENGFVIETSATVRRGHTDYLIANTVNFNK